MMGYYGGSMMGSWGVLGLLGLITWIELPVIGALVIVWLWRHISK